ncbi:MAG TPA: hypothetical protein PK122_00845, partial [Candidatus Paceibacterota bacterium]|nr:hypothetical protein [Candidatus Paceibacterota bacterium]
MILDFQNNGAVVLTTQEPGAFLNFRWETGDGSIYINADPISDVSRGILWVNGLDISQEASIYGDPSINTELYLGDAGDPSIASLFLYTRELIPFDVNLHITTSLFTIDVSVLNRPYIISSDSISTFETSNVQVEGEASYLLLRTNPKFSGNIKLTVDTSNYLYLDTFKVSDILSNKLYRKQKVSASSVLSGDIRRVFSSLPLGEMYRLDAEDTLNIAIPKTDLFDQYNVNYTYGARLFQDELYEDDYAMLAPLWINSKLPDYFAIFRVPGVINEETYPLPGEEEDLSGLADKFIRQGELMESWGIKEGSPLGTYLRNHLKELTQVISPMFLSLSDPNLKDPDPNTWYGVAIDKGIITGRSETTYFFDEKASNFTDLNAFCSQGFERLNLLCPNLINMEYAFSDDDVSLFTMHRYFGLYLTENPLYQISYYSDDPDSSIRVISLDGKDSSEFFFSELFDSNGDLKEEYENRIFTLDDILSIKRITNVHQVDGTTKSDIEEWVNKPGDNIFSTKVQEIVDFSPFISIGINNLLNQGEHLRIVDNTDFCIWEVLGSETDLLEPGESWTYATEYSDDGYPTVRRTLFSTRGTKKDQNNALWKAWNVFADYPNTPFRTFAKKDESHSLVIEDWALDHDIKFQRLTAQTTSHVFDTLGTYDPSSAFNSAAKYDDVIFYGTLIPSETDFQRLKYDSSFGPINFELFGDRMSIMLDIFNPNGYSFYSLDSSIVDVFEENMLYLSPDNWYRLIRNFDISTAISHSLQYIEDPRGNYGKIGIITEHPIVTINEYWNAYAVYPLIISLMGINPVKDFDFTVYDSLTDEASVGIEM